ncbi:bifunctional diguanylate cyclase/phosphodiesterase [Pseudoalteromonas sp. T1lg10]|uniref:bifunctional diguanylate cyclase/phosphodiesterase n=1 Tax=Pseudoalteromonas sp. T1lg10 TaxID=2077093 RepID=UPI000CF65A02|nr:bifunctional diguanylate cyclase/phosphodiesterase [Pseudoalteromonas sp. T1lg10]
MIAELTLILRQRSITTLFQPIFDVTQQQIIGYEALSRGPEGSPLHAPAVLFQCAQQARRLSELELLCRETAIATFAKLGLTGKLFLNVSPNTLLDPAHPKGQTLHLLRKYGLGPEQVVIELTEQDKVEDARLLRIAVEHYRELGFQIAIDDLGAGYSGLKQWSEIRPELVKIDRYFIDHCDFSPVKREFLKSIIDLAKATNTRLIAEGIERFEEFQLLTRLGIDNVQGYLLACPSAQPECHYRHHHMPESTWRAGPARREQGLNIGYLAQAKQALCQQTSCSEAQKVFAEDNNASCVVVLDSERRPVGLLYKERLSELFSTPGEHAFYDRQAISAVMERSLLVVDENDTLDSVSHQITDGDLDIRRHIIVTRAQQYLGVVPLRIILKHITEEKVRHAQHANPLTMLPGNIAINEAIEQRLHTGSSFTLAYFDLNHFKPFNDLYGYDNGDGVIKLVAELIRRHTQTVPCFVGHIGGDDFMVVFDDLQAQAICAAVIADFDRLIEGYFSTEHIKAKGYWSCDRQGRRQFIPLLSLAVGLVSPDINCCHNGHQVAALAADAIKEAKCQLGSYVFCCQRRKPAAPLYRLHQQDVSVHRHSLRN